MNEKRRQEEKNGIGRERKKEERKIKKALTIKERKQ